MNKNIILRDAFGVDASYSISESEIEELRTSFRGIAPYVILFTARSGSTFLTHEIAAASVLSVPNEWFSWLYVREDIEKKGGTPVDFIKRLIETKKSATGVFGVETNRLMLDLFEDLIPLHKVFPRKPRWFYLRRRNLVAQSISNYMADKSRVFHSYQLDGSSAEKIESVPYSPDELKKYVQNFIAEERWCETRFKNMNVAPVNLFYEDIIANPKHAAMVIANVMGVWLPASYTSSTIENPMKKMSGNKNAEFERRFRAEEVDFLAEQFDARGTVMEHAKSI